MTGRLRGDAMAAMVQSGCRAGQEQRAGQVSPVAATGKCVALEEAGEELLRSDLDVTRAKVVGELLA